jgi:uncharacterized membrane protein YeaQ/YmgE (transglycosylase-associated protein family)
MDIILWIVMGLVAGWLASVVMKTNATQGAGMDILFGIIGAVVGGFLFNLLGQPGVSGFNVYSLIVATIGAVVTIWLERTIRARA